MGKFLERHKISKLIQEELENLNRPILMKEIELTVKNFPTDKILCLDGLVNEFFKTFFFSLKHLKKKLIAVLHKLFQKT